jgi:hypothetical protein
MDLTKELLDEVVLAAKGIEYGDITLSISGQPNNKIVDIITKKRDRFRENCQSADSGEIRYERAAP